MPYYTGKQISKGAEFRPIPGCPCEHCKPAGPTKCAHDYNHLGACVRGCGVPESQTVLGAPLNWHVDDFLNRLERETRRDPIKEAEQRGASDMLESIRASLREYPRGGGDIEVMQEVDRIVGEALYAHVQEENTLS